jgi:glycosyltransferase involved in cell wall biosynthesis
MKEICVVAPIYNEESIIEEFIKQVLLNLNKITTNHEIILVDDGSSDRSWHLIKKVASKNKKIKAIKLSRNFGHHYAITAGLHQATANWTVVMDSDLQDRPEVIIELYNKAKQGFEVVFVSRKNRPESKGYLLAQKTFYFILNVLSGLNFNSKHANFSIINYKVVEAFKNFPESSRFYGSTIRWLGFNTSEVEANHGSRHSGKPSYTFKKRFKLASDIILAFSDRPLKLAIVFGLLMALTSTILLILTFVGTFQIKSAITGWASILIALFFVGGSILVVLGIIGVYVGRVFRQVKNRPLYVISSQINFKR